MMKIRKTIVIAVLITFCLTATLFLVKTTRSQTPSQYDPWADITGPNGVPDGKIDMRDIGYAAKLFGTSGDSTKNVNVTNFPLDVQGNLKTTNYLPSGTFNTSCKISIETTSVIGSGAAGIYVPSDDGASFFFIFDPLTPDFNASRIVLQSISDSFAVQQAQIFLNGINVGTLTFATQNQPTVTAAPITQVQTLQPGMNNLTVHPLQSTILVQDLSLFVEYQYTR